MTAKWRAARGLIHASLICTHAYPHMPTHTHKRTGRQGVRRPVRRAVRRVRDLRDAPQVSDLHVGLLARVRRMKCLVVAEPVQVLIVLLEDLEVVLAVRLILEVVEESEENLERDEGVGTGLMLRAHPDDVQLLGDLLEPSV